jgi:hypothetical protein
MQTVSGTLAAAILAPVREVIWRVRVDWNRSGSFTDLAVKDLSADVVSIRRSAELANDLPQAAKLFTASAVSQATVVLRHRGSDPAQHGAWYYSGYNPASPLYGYKRKGAPCIIEVGFVGTAGPEYVRILTGTVRALEVSSGGRTATLTVMDRAETMRRQITLPMIVAEGQTETGVYLSPGLSASFLADYILRACGYYASPPRRPEAVLVATMHGSGAPELGRIHVFHGYRGSMLPFVSRPTAKWLQGLKTQVDPESEVTYVLEASPGISTSNGWGGLVQGWFTIDGADADHPLWMLYRIGQTTPWISLFWQTPNNVWKLLVNRGGSDPINRAVTGPSFTPTEGVPIYVGCSFYFTSTGITAYFRIGGTTTGPVTLTTNVSVSNAPMLNGVAVARGKASNYAETWHNGLTEDFQVTAARHPSGSEPAWDDAFTPTAVIEPTRNTLAATPDTTEQAWGLLQQLAAAEFATAYFDEQGVPYYLTRDHWDRDQWLTVQRTLSTVGPVTELASVEAIDQVRNRVIVRVESPLVQPATTVWRLGIPAWLPALTTRRFTVQFQDPVANLDLTPVYSGDPSVGSRYLAGNRIDGSGGQVSNLVFVVTQLGPTTATIDVTNPNNFSVWLTVDQSTDFIGTYAGEPYLVLNGQPVTFGGEAASTQRVEASDAASIAGYGEQLLELEANPFRQDADSMQALAADLLFTLKDAGPVLLDSSIVADPRLQLGDRVRGVDAAGLALAADFHLSRVDLEAGPSEGMRQTVSFRPARAISYFDAGFYDDGKYDQGTYD